MKIKSRLFNFKSDLTQAQTFLYSIYKITNLPQIWFPDRLENNPNELDGNVRIWEEIVSKNASRIVGMTLFDGPHYYYSYTHPNFNYLDGEMI